MVPRTITSTEKRQFERRRTRLRSGKILTLKGDFVIECQFFDIAGGGARIRLVDNRTLPDRFWLFDDMHCQALIVDIVWRKGLELGVQFRSDPSVAPLAETRLAELAGKYYSV